jgi:hypothetical protein
MKMDIDNIFRMCQHYHVGEERKCWKRVVVQKMPKAFHLGEAE